MTMHAVGKFTINSWDEKPYQEIEEGGKLTKATVSQRFEGDIVGEGTVVYLMAYPGDGTANFVGFTRIVGSVGGKSGSFILQCAGSFEAGVAKSDWFVVRGSGTDGLRGLRGKGGYVATHETVSLTLDYEIV